MFRNSLIRLLAASSLTACAIQPVYAQTGTTAADAGSLVQLVTSQLPRNAVPLHYNITVTPNADDLSFTSKVSIDINLVEASNAITLNAADLVFVKAAMRKGKGKATLANVTIDAAAQTATLAFPKRFARGKYTLDIDYSGKIYQQANGLFALDYKDTKGAKKRALFTQFEAPDARRFVPSWDEPNYKATFDLTAIVPEGQMAVSNMPVQMTFDGANGKKAYRFATSPKMSTYLLFFGLGEFDRIAKKANSTEVGVIVGRGNGTKGQYALDASAEIVDYYDEYFGVPYPLPKLDNVAGPGQSQFFSAMENWGAIFTFERILLVDPKITSARAKQRIFATDAHEIAYQWFGNLVTMQWWDDLWLNEGFASWMESKTTQRFNPDWQVELDRVYGREGAMAQDAYVTTHPIIQTIKTVEQTSQAFDTITYSKGEAVITMLEGFAGEDIWRDGIRKYIKKHAYGNTKTDDLWNEVEAAGAAGLTKIAHDFTKQGGVPLIKVGAVTCEFGNSVFTLTQGEFSRDRKAQTDANPQSWDVPVIAQTVGGAPITTIVSDASGPMIVPGCGSLIVNAGQSGYYRTLYQPDQIAALSRDFGKLSASDQAGLLSDNRALANNGYQDMEVAFGLLDAVPNDASQRVIEQAVGEFGGLFDLLKEDTARQNKLAKIANTRFAPTLTKLGLSQKPDELAIDSNLRSGLIGTLSFMGNAEIAAEAGRLFAALENDPAAMDGPLRTTWLGIIAYNADKATWDKIRKLAQSADSSVVKSSMYRLLGATKDKALAADALKLALTDEPGATTSASIISAVAGEHPEMAVDFALANKAAVLALVDVGSRSEYIGGLGYGSEDPAMPAKLDAYAKSDLTPESRKTVDEAIAAINTRLITLPRVKAGVVKGWTANRSNCHSCMYPYPSQVPFGLDFLRAQYSLYSANL
jgi:aminopeptidase N